MKVAVSVPDPVFSAGEQVAHRLGISRSRLYTQALEAFVKSQRALGVREALEATYGSQPSELDPVLDKLQAEALREEW
jgi:hypothetical protein